MSRRGIVRRLGAGLAAVGLLAGCASPPATPSASPSASSARPPVTPTASASSASATPSPRPTQTPRTPFEACLAQAGELSLAEQVGQLYMMAIQVGTPVETAVVQMTDSQAGAVILLGNWTGGLDSTAQYTQTLQAAAPPGRPVLVAADQEGGLVQRLSGPGFATIPSAVEQGTFPDAELRGSWQRWGRELRNAGVHFNLAPVADVVPAAEVWNNPPVGQLDRGFGSDPEQVARQVGLVIQGLSDARVASSIKHFPGLGRVSENTDFAVAHDSVSTGSDAELLPFSAAIEAGASSVMISSAIYDQIDPANPAVFSSAIIEGILRERLGFDGVVISDDLGVAASVASYPVAERGTLFLQAGGDMVIVADAAAAQQMVDATLAVAQADPVFAAELATKVARLLALKQSYGLMNCG